MFAHATLRGVAFTPARFCAPLAGFTHSAFRRVVASLGGCGAFWTEMLSARHLLHEDLARSPYLRRSADETRLVYQLMLRPGDPIDRVVERVASLQPDGIDVNLACHAPAIRHLDAGSRLFTDAAALARALGALRAYWPGLLLVKIRLGPEDPGWRDVLRARLRLFEDAGVDALTLHPRFFEDKFKRRARHEELAWVAAQTRLPVIANGDLDGPGAVAARAAHLARAAAVMVGRMAVVQPWIFAHWDRPVPVDHAALWHRMADEIEADFAPVQALGRLKLFTTYYARNFHFGHTLATAVQNAPDLAAARARAGAFLADGPPVLPEPSLQGL